MDEYSVVIGVDAGTLNQFKATFRNWAKHKPSLMQRPWVVFHDADPSSPYAVKPEQLNFVHTAVADVQIVGWPLTGISPYGGNVDSKWYRPQRYKMLAGFVHVPADYVQTPYWLKLDVDSVAEGPDHWIDPSWFKHEPAIIAHKWGYTKPPEQMGNLDYWAEANQIPEFTHPPLTHLRPKTPESSMISHKRIISWCGFFNTDFTSDCSYLAETYVAMGHLPVPSQDGYLWYCAQRMGLEVKRVNMKSKGWHHCSRLSQIEKKIKEIDA